MRKTVVAIVIGLAALLVLAVLAGAWLFRFRPLTVYAWTTRSALARAGLHKTTVESPAGPQGRVDGGSGPKLVLLHGAGDQAGTWFRVAPALARDHTLIVPDLAGHGDSAPRTGPIEASAVYAGVVATIDALAPGERVTIVGNSLGGWMAMLVGPSPARTAWRSSCASTAARSGAATSTPGCCRGPAPRRASRWRRRATRAAHRSPTTCSTTSSGWRRPVPSPASPPPCASMEPFILDDAALGEIRVPVRLIWGASDRLMPLEYAKRMEAALPDVRLATIDACGHVPQVECPERFLTALRSALTAGADSSLPARRIVMPVRGWVACRLSAVGCQPGGWAR